MSANPKTSGKGVRYSDAQKKEVTDFVTSYNTSNGRGGQSKAAEKFGISQLTIASWLKSGGKKKASKKAAKATSSKPAKKAAKKGAAKKAGKKAKAARAGRRGYDSELKNEIIAFANAHNEKHGRGGQSAAAAKYGVSPLTLTNWFKGVKGGSKKGAKKGAKRGRKPASGGSIVSGLSSKLSELLSLHGLIDKAESELAKLKSKFDSLKSSL